LIKQLIAVLHWSFPKDENNFSEIEHYCFDMNFGKQVEGEGKTASELYSELISNARYDFMASTHPFIDEKKISAPACELCRTNKIY
jgi:hypothetical protein